MAGTERAGLVPFSKILVVVQVALSLTLLIGAVLFVRTFRNLMSVDAGFERDHVFSARFDPRMAGFTEARLPALYDRLLERAAAIPGTRNTALAVSGTVSGSSRSSSITIQGRTPSSEDEDARDDFVTPEYFATLGIDLVRGRMFGEHDDARSAPVVVINEAMARHFFPNGNALGGHVSDGESDAEVVGIVRDTRVDGPRDAVPAMMYHPLRQRPLEYVRYLYVRIAGSPERARTEIRRAIAEAEPNLAVREVVSLAELTERTVSRERLVSNLTAVFGLLAVAVACLGLYGTVSYSVARRTNEIGVRLALGASPSAVRWMVLRETLVLVGLGATVGLVLAFAALRGVGSLLYGLSPRDPLTFLLATVLVGLVGSLAGAFPAWRASHIDPVTALRLE